MLKELKYRLYRLKWDYGPFLPMGSLPVHLDLEVTSRCNLACIMCPHGTKDQQFKIGDMPYDAARLLIKAGSGKINSIKFNWRGEPTLYSKLADLISYAKECGYIETMINTNLNCSKKILENIILSGLDKLIISVDSFLPDAYRLIRKGGDLALVLDNLGFVKTLKENKKLPVSIVVQARRQKLNENEVFPAYVAVKPASRRTPEGGYIIGGQASAGRRNCLMPFRRILVSWDGFAYGCCADWFGINSIGSVDTEDCNALSKIWNGQKMKKLRDGLKTGRAFACEPCKSCFSRESYIWKK